jgi:hypothetical protein
MSCASSAQRAVVALHDPKGVATWDKYGLGVRKLHRRHHDGGRMQLLHAGAWRSGGQTTSYRMSCLVHKETENTNRCRRLVTEAAFARWAKIILIFHFYWKMSIKRQALSNGRSARAHLPSPSSVLDLEADQSACLGSPSNRAVSPTRCR